MKLFIGLTVGLVDELPGAAFLRKPFTATELARKVREVLDAAADPAPKGSGEVPSRTD